MLRFWRSEDKCIASSAVQVVLNLDSSAAFPGEECTPFLAVTEKTRAHHLCMLHGHSRDSDPGRSICGRTEGTLCVAPFSYSMG